MFKFLKGNTNRQPDSENHEPLSRLNANDLATTVRRFLAELEEEPSAWLMTMMGVQVLHPVLTVSRKRVADGEGQNDPMLRKVARTDFWLTELYPKFNGTNMDNADQLRAHWTYMGAAVIRATEEAPNDPESQENVAKIWGFIVRGTPFVSGALTNNVLWTEKEKFPFVNLPNPAFGVELLMGMRYIPSQLKGHQIIVDAKAQALEVAHQLSR